jgi:IS4 transposase
LLWRVKSNLNLPVEKRLPDGSYITTVRSSTDKNNSTPIKIRVIEYRLKGTNFENGDEVYRLVTSLSNHKKYLAFDLATLYHQRWEIEIVFKEIKSSLNNNNSVLRSHKSDLVKQEMWAILITHFAVRQVMAKTAWDNDLDPLKLSFQGNIHILRRKIPQAAVFPPSEDQ